MTDSVAKLPLEDLLEHVACLLCVSDFDGRVIALSRAWEGALGWTSREIEAAPLMQLVHADDRESALSAFSSIVEGAPSAEFEARYRRKDGGYTWLRCHSVPDSGARLVHSTARDVTREREERQRSEVAEERARSAETRARSLFEAALDGAIVIDARGTIERFNSAAERMFGYSAAELIGQNIRMLTPSPHREQHDAYLRRYVETREARVIGIGREVEGVRKDGSHFPLVLSINEMNIDGQTFFTGITRDLTARREAERALAESERQLLHAQRMESIGVLAGGVAHDFNNLLSVIFSYADAMREDLGDATDDIDEIINAAKRAATLTRQLLAFSRKQILRTKTTTLNRVVFDMQKMMRRLVREDIEIALGLDPDPCSVAVDVGQMEQVLMNLVVNAGDAMQNGGSITFSTSTALVDAAEADAAGVEPGEYAVLTVADTGEGMDALTRRRIFEPFFTTKESGKGTGLGLSVVFGIVQQSGGWVRVESTLGVGTTFVVSIPGVDRPESGEFTAASPISTRVAETGQAAQTVLVVEDEPMVRLAVRRLLLAAGYTVLVASDGDDALQRVEEHEGAVDLMISDVVMPGMSGTVLADAARAQNPGLRVLLMTGYIDDPDARSHLEMETTPVLEKPFSGQQLLAAVAAALAPS